MMDADRTRFVAAGLLVYREGQRSEALVGWHQDATGEWLPLIWEPVDGLTPVADAIGIGRSWSSI